MPVKYHVSASGKPAICHAQQRPCPKNAPHETLAELTQRGQSGKKGQEAFNDVLDQLEGPNDVHYRLYLLKGEDTPKVAQVSSFDYSRYDGSRFMDERAYKTEVEAELAAKDFNDKEAPESLKAPLTRAEKRYQKNAADENYSAFSNVVDQLEDYNDVHYRVYLSKRTNEPTSVCVQSFDYFDYEDARFLESKAYKTEEEAELAAEDYNDVGLPEEKQKVLSPAAKIYRQNVKKGELSPFSDVVGQLDEYEDVHYRTYLSPRTNTPVTVCVQYFDYHDYEASRFLEPKAYKSEEAAIRAAKRLS